MMNTRGVEEMKMKTKKRQQLQQQRGWLLIMVFVDISITGACDFFLVRGRFIRHNQRATVV